jgi:hypothetical protein
MPRLLSGSTLRRGGSGQYIDLAGAQPQLPATATTLTGFTLITDSLLRSDYRSSLGFIEFNTASMYSSLPEGTIRILATGTGSISTSTATGALVVTGGIGVGGGITVKNDIVVNGLTIGRGYDQGVNNIVIKGTAATQNDNFENGQENVVIGYDALKGLTTSYKNIAVGRYALNSGTEISNSIAIGDSALKTIGTNNRPIASNITGVTIKSSKSVNNVTGTNPVVITSNSHGLTAGTQILITGVNGVTIGGNNLLNGIPFWIDNVTTNTFSLYTNKSRTNSLNGVGATAYISSGTITSPVILTSPNHLLSTGTLIYIEGIVGTAELNDPYYYQHYYIDVLTSSTVALFTDEILNIPLDGTGYTAYSSGGIIRINRENDNNIAVGTNAGLSLINGQNNFFLGNNIARNFTTGSNNFFIGHDVANNMTHGNGMIAFGGDNLEDGIDNQVSIGSVFYYDGTGYAYINADATLGLGTESTGTDSGGVVVLGGLGVAGNIYSGGSGNPDENNLLYTPKVTVSATAPTSPRVGDTWINPAIPAYLQYIKDGTNTFWIQVGSI